jgi:multidrug efflux pump subunit AcrA (membrane-fusion protein)
VNFSASERDVMQVRANLARACRTTADLLGLPVEIGLQTESGYPNNGKLDYVAATVDPSTGTLAVRAILENSDRILLPGYFVRVRIPSRPEPTLFISDAAISSDTC